MFNMKHIQNMITAESERKKSSSKPKKPAKRKRKSSKREPDDDHTAVVLAEDKHLVKENQASSAADSFIPLENQASSVADSFIAFNGDESNFMACNGDKSKHSQCTYPVSKKKKPIKKGSEFMKTRKDLFKSEKLPTVVKKKKRKKTKVNSDIQNLEAETEGSFTLNDVHDEVTSKVKGKKPKPSMSKSQNCKSNSNSENVSDHLETSCYTESKSNLDNTNESKKELPLKNISRFNESKKAKHRKHKKAPFYEKSLAQPKVKQPKVKQPKVKQPKVKLTAEEKRKLNFQKKDEAKALELSVKRNMVSHPADMINVGKDTFIVILIPGQSIYVHGLLSVRPLVGRVTILGYRLQEMERQHMFSFNSHALLSVQAIEGYKLSVSKHTHLLEYGLTSKQLQEIVDKQSEPVVVVELQKCSLPIVRQLSIIGEQKLMTPAGNKSEENLWGMLISEENCHKYHLTRETAEWKETMENICLSFECGNAPRVVVCGGKGVGKSTLFKYIVNGLLSKKGTKVNCLDIDPGQTELSLPSCISLTQVTEPLLGPPYTHHAEPSSSNVKQIMMGGVTPQFGLQRYIRAVKHLYELSKDDSDCPLVVNTMGWTVGTGLDLILDTIRIVQPTHVLQIEGTYTKTNFGIALSDSVVNDRLGGILTKPGQGELHYSLTEIKALSGTSDKIVSFTPKLLRELAVSLHLSNIVSDLLANSADQERDTHNTVIVKWPKVVLHVCGPKVPKQRILQVLNGNLVALCHVDSSKIESVSPDLPKHLIDDLDFGQCVGWGVVRGIDPLTKELHILTTVSSDKMDREVNAIIKPELHLPDKFYGFFTEDEGPYYQKMYRTGAGRLKISRQIKPGMATLGPRKND